MSERPNEKVHAKTLAAEKTRAALMDAASRQIRLNGFQSARVDDIVSDVKGLTKGAFYHHFKNKQALGYAVFDESYAAWFKAFFIAPLKADTPVLDTLITQIESAAEFNTDASVTLGCPINNLANEMSPLDTAFQQQIANLYKDFKETLAASIRRDQKRDYIRQDLNPEHVATFVLAGIQGGMTIAKPQQKVSELRTAFAALVIYLHSLKA